MNQIAAKKQTDRKRMDFLFPATFVDRVKEASAERDISFTTLVILAVNEYVGKGNKRNV